jgi:hypothetical protein
MKDAGIRFQQAGNCFRQCSDPEALQKLADSLTANHVRHCGHKWINRFIPFFRAQERREAGCWHQLFFAQAEYCENLVFRRRAALDELGDRLLDANRNIGALPIRCDRSRSTRRRCRVEGRLMRNYENKILTGDPITV